MAEFVGHAVVTEWLDSSGIRVLCGFSWSMVRWTGACDHRRVVRWMRRRVLGAVAVGVTGDAVLAVRADAAASHASAWPALADLAVGLVFALAAVVAAGPAAQRWLMAAVGAVWLAGSWLPAAGLLHQGVLVVALAAFPAGRLRGRTRWPVAALGVPVALGVFPRAGVAAVLGLVAVVAAVDRGRGQVARWYPALAGAGTGAVLATAAWWEGTLPESFDPALAFFGWQVVLVAVAAGFPVASRLVLAERARLADRMIGAAAPEGLDGLTAVLRRTLHDRTIRIRRWEDTALVDIERGPSRVTLAGRGPSRLLSAGRGPSRLLSADRRRLVVSDGGQPLAVVEHATPALDDAATAAAVSEAVRLTLINLRLQEEQRAHLAEVRLSRARLLAAADRVRSRVARQLHEDVLSPLSAVRDEVASTRHGLDHAEAAAALDVVLHELTEVSQEIAALVAGVPPADLGGGRLSAALESLARACPVTVTVTVAPGEAGSALAETVLFYVCSEALTNAIKHAGATRVRIEVRRAGADIEASVADDGCGGADPRAGSGLRGLADRVAAHGGRLRLESPRGTGTVITVAVSADL